jgi:DUF971 family protein
VIDDPIPTEIRLDASRRRLIVSFGEGEQFDLPSEYLRVYSPSADVAGHSPDSATLQVGKENVKIRDVEPVGNYAVRLLFDDGHSAGIYSWTYLFRLGRDREANWQDYLARLSAAGHFRAEPDEMPER